MKRRDFIKLSVLSAAGAVVLARFGWARQQPPASTSATPRRWLHGSPRSTCAHPLEGADASAATRLHHFNAHLPA